MGQTSPRREKAPSWPHPRPAMWYLSSWRNLPRRSNAGHGLLNKPEITPPSHSNHRRDGTRQPANVERCEIYARNPASDPPHRRPPFARRGPTRPARSQGRMVGRRRIRGGGQRLPSPRKRDGTKGHPVSARSGSPTPCGARMIGWSGGPFRAPPMREPFAWAISRDNRTVFGADTDGQFRLTILEPNRMELCYTHPGLSP